MVRIAFGQQPNGFFPKRFFVAKILTARRLQAELGGEIVFFYHDSDHDYRETVTTLIDLSNNHPVKLNFTQKNKLQKKFSPLYAKRIPSGWQEEMARKLPTFIKDTRIIDHFKGIKATTVADFCLAMYEKLGLLEGLRVVRSSDPKFREQTSVPPTDRYFVDVEYEGEIVRAQMIEGKLQLHQGGGQYLALPEQPFNPRLSGGRDLTIQQQRQRITPQAQERLPWMQSALHCTHYIMGDSETVYMDRTDTPDITFLQRDAITDPHGAWIQHGQVDVSA